MKLTKEKLKMIIKEELAILQQEMDMAQSVETKKEEMDRIVKRLGELQAELESIVPYVENDPVATEEARKKIKANGEQHQALIARLNSLFPSTLKV